MRVTLISKACVVGAYQTKLEEIARHPDIELTAVVPPSWRERGHRLTLERAHVRDYRLVVAPIALNGSFHAHFYPTLPRILAEARPDLCHIDEEPYNLATHLALSAARRVGARTVFFAWQNLLRRYPWPFRAMEAGVLRSADGALAGNQAAAQVLRGKCYIGPLRVIPQFGVDADLFAPRPPAASCRPFTIGYAGRVEEHKGLATLVDALVRLDGDWRLYVAGSGSWRDSLVARLAQAGFASRLHEAGQVPSEQMPEHYARMDVLVLPSLTKPNWMEQFGRVLIEAMACAVPVVGSDSGEIPNVIGDAGFVFPEGDADTLRQRLSALRADATLRAGLARRGRARVLDQYTQAQIADRTVDFYRDVMGA